MTAVYEIIKSRATGKKTYRPLNGSEGLRTATEARDAFTFIAKKVKEMEASEGVWMQSNCRG